MASIIMEDITKTYQNGKSHKTVMENLNLKIEDGSFTVLVGPSGCGKTTAIRMIAGLENVSKGRIIIDGVDVTHWEPGDRSIALVFQNYALYPHMTVERNISFGLKNYGYKKAEIAMILDRVLEMVGLTEYRHTKPGQLSGGQRQRVALARAISKSPGVFLMDEPLSNLDARLRVQMRSEIIRIHRQLHSTFVYITHDQTEAMTMGDKIAVMNGGKIMQYGTPEEVYDHPENIFTAQFIGDPGMNIVRRADGISLGFRPQNICFDRVGNFDGLTIKGRVSTRERLGEIYHYTAMAEDGNELALRTQKEFSEGDEVKFYVPQEALHAFDAAGIRTELAGVGHIGECA